MEQERSRSLKNVTPLISEGSQCQAKLLTSRRVRKVEAQINILHIKYAQKLIITA